MEIVNKKPLTYFGDNDLTPVQQFYHEKSVLITGASGFMGKVLLEKLLRSCAGVGNVYLLLRPKRGELPTQRIEKLMKDPIFERLRRERGSLVGVQPGVVAISGDISRPGLGLSAADRAVLVSSVEVVFHVAATVRFNEKLKVALQTNLGGTHSVMQLCKDMHQLKSFVYVSTAYSNSPRAKIDEVVYSPPVDPDKLLQCMEWMSEEQFEDLAPSLLGEWPNTYTYSKMLAEALVTKHCTNMPVAIFRPAIVISTHKEPVVGWLDNLNGPAGITIGSLMGTIRCFHCDSRLKVDLIPVDMATNAMLVSAWVTANNNTVEPKVYNFVSSARKPITWKEYTRICELHGLPIPPEKAMWYYCLTLTSNKSLYRLMCLFMHDIPARLIDIVPRVMGRGAKMTKLYAKIDQFSDVLSYFTTRQWDFSDNNVQSLHQECIEADKALFPLNIAELQWDSYLKSYMLGLRTYLLKEPMDNLTVARRKYFALFCLHRSMQLGMLYGSFRVILGLTSVFSRYMKQVK